MGKIGLIIGREYLTRVRKKSFLIMTLLGPLLMGGFITLTIWLTVGESGQKKVLVVDQLGLTENLFDEKKGAYRFDFTDRSISSAEFLESDYDLMLDINTKVMENKAVALYYRKLPSLSTQSYIQDQLNLVLEAYRIDKIEESGEIENFNREVYARIRDQVNLKLLDAENGEEGDKKQAVAFVGFFFAILIYMFIFLYGVQVMRGVIEEKTSRIVEIIISSVKPFQLMMGKIVGVAMVGLTQFVLWVILTFVILITAQFIFFPDFYDPGNQVAVEQVATNISPMDLQANTNFEQNKVYDLVYNRIQWPLMIAMFIFYFLGGYLMYSALFAAVGAAVDSESDTQQFMMPITIPLVFGFIVAQMAIENPESNTVFWTSIIPFTSPVVMMVRVAMGFDAGNIWELFLSMGLLVAGFLFFTWLAGRIYRTGILMYGKKVSYKELWKWLLYKG